MPDVPGELSLEERLVGELPGLRAYLRRVAGAGCDVEDMLQEVAARALKYAHAFDHERALGPWLRGLALRVVLDHRERARRAPHALEHAPESSERNLEHVEHRDDVARLLSKLPAVERDVLVRFHARGESVREISDALGMPEGTVKSHLHRARRRLGTAEAP